ncbi:MAG TPA: hypothetical protein VMR97_14415 [Acidimicrobiales bacterium]|nr:hypothetical protein [Acidimicrobiales bacterium]
MTDNNDRGCGSFRYFGQWHQCMTNVLITVPVHLVTKVRIQHVDNHESRFVLADHVLEEHAVSWDRGWAKPDQLSVTELWNRLPSDDVSRIATCGIKAWTDRIGQSILC